MSNDEIEKKSTKKTEVKLIQSSKPITWVMWLRYPIKGKTIKSRNKNLNHPKLRNKTNRNLKNEN